MTEREYHGTERERALIAWLEAVEAHHVTAGWSLPLPDGAAQVVRELIDEAGRMAHKAYEWRTKYEATVSAWDAWKRSRETDAKQFDELLASLRVGR